MPTEIVKTLLTTQAYLDQLGVPSAMIGGLAVSAWGHSRATKDIDLLVGSDFGESDTLLRSLQDRNYRPRALPAVVDFDGEHVMLLEYQPPGEFFEFKVDLFLAESDFHRSALARRQPFPIPGVAEPVPVITCEDLILFKLRADRAVDHSDVIVLLQTNSRQIDFAYINQWLMSPDIRRTWSQSWSEAFPDKPDPIGP